MNLAILTTLWGRESVSNVILPYYVSIDPCDEIYRLAVASTISDAETAESAGWDITHYENEPLNEKHNHGMEILKHHEREFGAVCVVNSDQLVTREWLNYAHDKIESGEADVVRFYSEAFYDLPTGRFAFSRKSYPGGGVVLSRDVLDALSWRPWDGSPINRFLDTRLFKNVMDRMYGVTGVTPSVDHRDPRQLCSLKSEENLWPYDEHLELIGETSRIDMMGDEYMEYHFPGVSEKLFGQHVSDQERQ